MNPATGGGSAPDITLATADLATSLSWETDKGMGSDHLPIIISVPMAPPKAERRGKGRLAFRKADWEGYRSAFDRLAVRWEDRPTITAREMDQRLTATITRAARQTIPYGNGGKTRAPFWNRAYEEAIKARAAARTKASSPNHAADDVRAYGDARKHADQIPREEKSKRGSKVIWQHGRDFHY